MVTLLVTFKRTRRRKPWLKCFDLVGEPDGNVLAKENQWLAVTNLPNGVY
jgi:hypothetical protein